MAAARGRRVGFTRTREIVVDAVGCRGARSEVHGRQRMDLRPRAPVIRSFKEAAVQAHVIAMVGLKGGMGRTTVGMLLAMAVARKGRKVMVLDADPQGSATVWHARTPADGVAVVPHVGSSSDLPATIEELRSGCDLLIVDCPPHTEETSDLAAASADLVLAPIRLGPTEVWATPRVIDLVARARQKRPRLLFAAVINQVRRTKLADALIRKLTDVEGVPLLKARLHERTAYSEAVLRPLRDKHALGETDALAKEVLELLAGPRVHRFSRWRSS